MASPVVPRREAHRWTRWLVVLAGSLAAAVLLFGVPFGAALSFGLLLVCPILMLGMHGHASGDRHGVSGSRSAPTGQRGPEGTRFIPWD